MGAQFHSRLMFMLLSKFDLTESFKWHYNEAYHGEGSINGILSTVKNLVFRAMKSEKNFSNNVKKVSECCEFSYNISMIYLQFNLIPETLLEPPEVAKSPYCRYIKHTKLKKIRKKRFHIFTSSSKFCTKLQK